MAMEGELKEHLISPNPNSKRNPSPISTPLLPTCVIHLVGGVVCKA